MKIKRVNMLSEHNGIIRCLRLVEEIERGKISEVKYGIQSKSMIKNWVKNFGEFDRTYELEKSHCPINRQVQKNLPRKFEQYL